MLAEDEVYCITPKGIAIVSLLNCALINNINDPRVNGFWTMFEASMKKHGYIKED